MSTALSLLLGVPAAYALSRWRFRAQRQVALWILATRMAPPIAFTIPFFLAFTCVGLIDTVTGLVIIYLTFNLALVIWTMRGFFEPCRNRSKRRRGSTAAACGARFCVIALPLSAPGLAATGDPVLHPVVERFLLCADPDAHRAMTAPVAIVNFMQYAGLGVGQDRRRRRPGDAAGRWCSHSSCAAIWCRA